MSFRRSEASSALHDGHAAATTFSSHLQSNHSMSGLSQGGSSSSLPSTSSVSAAAPTTTTAAAAATGTAASPPTTMMGPSTTATIAYTGSILMQGKLMRRDRTFKKWKWRDFTLERTRLQYFSEKGTRKGEIMLSATTPITIRLLSEPKPHSFLLFIKDEKLTLAALNENEQRKWIDVFCDVFHASVEQAPSDKSDRRARPTFLPIPDIAKDKSHAIIAASTASAAVHSSALPLKPAAPSPPFVADASPNYPDVIPILESRMTYGPLQETYSRVTFPPSLANGDLLVGVGPIVRRMGWTDERILAIGLYIDPDAARQQLETFVGRTVKRLSGDQSFYDHVLAHTTFRRSFVITARKRVSKSVLTALFHDEIGPRIGTARDGLETFLGFIERSLKKAESMVLRLNPDGRFEYRLRGQLYPPIQSQALCKCVQAMLFDSNAIQHDAKRGLIERLPSLWGSEVLDAQDEIFGRVSHHYRAGKDGRRVMTAAGGQRQRGNHDSESEFDDSEMDFDESEDFDDDEFDDDDDDAFDDDDDDDAEVGEGKYAIEEGVIDRYEDSTTVIRECDEDDDDDDSDAGTSHRQRRSTTALKVMRPLPQAAAGGGYGRASDAAIAKRSLRRSSLSRAQKRRTLSRREELDDRDDREHAYLRRASRSVATHFGPLLDPDSNAHFAGDLLVDGSALLGTWSQEIAVAANSFDQPFDGAGGVHRFTVGLYVEPGSASESLLKYKGLSVGSIVQDPDFFARFAQSAFRKHLVIKVDQRMRLHTLIEFVDAHLQSLASSPLGPVVAGTQALPSGSPTLHTQTSNSSVVTHGATTTTDATVAQSFVDVFADHKYKQLLPKDDVRFSIERDGRLTLVIRKRTSMNKETAGASTNPLAPVDDDATSNRNDVDVSLPTHSPFAMLFQSVFYGFHTIDARSRLQLLQRLPILLDLAKDDLVHTYHDEIQVLKENYKRQLPENRVKVGYLAISFEKTKRMAKTSDGAVAAPTAVPSRWSKRWCRLDGVSFSYFSHKRSRKARDAMDLTTCDVMEITTFSGTHVAPFALESDRARPSIKIAITKPNGEILALRTESIYEGEEWLESLTDASHVRRRLSDALQPLGGSGLGSGHGQAWEQSIAQLRRHSSAIQGLRAGGEGGGEGVAGMQSGDNSANAMGGEKSAATAAASSSSPTDDEDEEDVDEYVDDDDDAVQVVVDKDASLVLWVREDPRHCVIAVLLVLVLWLVTSKVRADAAAAAAVASMLVT